jgi:hypothetical protein
MMIHSRFQNRVKALAGRYGADCHLGLRISAEAAIKQIERQRSEGGEVR